MYLSAEQKDLIAGFVNRQEVAQLIGYLESLDLPPEVAAQEAQAEHTTQEEVDNANA